MKGWMGGKSGSWESGLSLLEVMAALVILVVAIALFMKFEGRSRITFSSSSNLMNAGQLLEGQIEAIRIHIAQDTVHNWPPEDSLWKEKGITIRRSFTAVVSPMDGAALPNLRKVELQAVWGLLKPDTLQVTTYVSKRF